MLNQKNSFIFCEGVALGHPDRLADLICDAILDEYLKVDPYTHLGIEALLSKDLICITGEVESKTAIAIEPIVKGVLLQVIPRSIALFPEIMQIPIVVNLHHQSEELAKIDQYTQDQAIVVGFATQETVNKIPFPLLIARDILNRIEGLKGQFPDLGDDGKVLVAVDRFSKKVCKVLVSYQHHPHFKVGDLRDSLVPFLQSWLGKECECLVNPMGEFIHGTLLADSGVSGRKIVFESYGQNVPNGGGAMSGKDPAKVDRWGAYLARKMAVCALQRFNLQEITIKLAFSPGSKTIFGLSFETGESLSLSKEHEIGEFILTQFPLDVSLVIETLDLRKPHYFNTTFQGAFGNGASWDVV